MIMFNHSTIMYNIHCIYTLYMREKIVSNICLCQLYLLGVKGEQSFPEICAWFILNTISQNQSQITKSHLLPPLIDASSLDFGDASV